MMIHGPFPFRLAAFAALFALTAATGGCVNAMDTLVANDALSPDGDQVAAVSDPQAQECLARAMYFESNRSSESGMLAVGTVVMNRVESGSYPTSICGVVGQNRQFAPGVMTRAMGPGKDLAMKTAAAVLSGKRHPGVKTAKFFHTAGLKFPYRNMHYVAIAGGNAFYQKVGRKERQNIQLASQADVRSRQERASSQLTAVALAPREDEQRQNSPFASLWQALTDKPAARGTSSSVSSRQVAAAARDPNGKGGRVTVATEHTGTDDPSPDLMARMNGLPGVNPGPVATGSTSSSTEASGETATQLRSAFAGE